MPFVFAMAVLTTNATFAFATVASLLFVFASINVAFGAGVKSDGTPLGGGGPALPDSTALPEGGGGGGAMLGGEPGGGGGCLGLPLEVFGGGGGIGGRGTSGPATFATAAGDATSSGDGCQTPRLLVDAPSLNVRLNSGNSSTAEGSPS